MSNEVVIKFDNVTKLYKLYKSDKVRFRGLFFKNVPYKENRAVKNMSFEIRKGESVALVRGDVGNIKLTYTNDMRIARAMIDNGDIDNA